MFSPSSSKKIHQGKRDQQGQNLQDPERHTFAEKTILKSEECFICKEKIKFSSLVLKCMACRIVSHFTCKGEIPQLCAPQAPRSPFQRKKKFTSFPLNPGPEVPQILVDCIMEIDLRGPSSSPFPLYSFTPNESETQKLKEMILEDKLDWMQIKDVNVICAVVLDFLWSLTEPILPKENWHKFTDSIAAPTKPKIEENLAQEIFKLPLSSRDTIAFIIMHLQKISKLLDSDPLEENLVEKFTLGVIAVYDPTKDSKVRQMSMMIMTNLLKMSPEFWKGCMKE